MADVERDQKLVDDLDRRLREFRLRLGENTAGAIADGRRIIELSGGERRDLAETLAPLVDELVERRRTAEAGPGHRVLVTVDADRNNGRVSIARSMVPIWSPAGLLRAGDSVEVVCEEFDLTEAEAAVIAALVEDFSDLDLGEDNAQPPDNGCRPELVVVDGQKEVVRVVGSERMDDQDRAMLAELVAVTKAYVAKNNPHLGVIQELLAAERSARRCIPNGVVQTRLGRHDGVAVKERLRAAVQAARDALINPTGREGGGDIVDIP